MAQQIDTQRAPKPLPPTPHDAAPPAIHSPISPIDSEGRRNSYSLQRKPVNGHSARKPSWTADEPPRYTGPVPNAMHNVPRSAMSNTTPQYHIPRKSVSSIQGSVQGHSRNPSRDVETPEPERRRDSDNAIPVTRHIPLRQRQVDNVTGPRRTSQAAELAFASVPDSTIDDEELETFRHAEESQEPEVYPQLQYHHQPYTEPPPTHARNRMHSSADSQGSGSEHGSLGRRQDFLAPRSTIQRPNSAYTPGSDLNGSFMRGHSPHLSLGGSPHGSPVQLGRLARRSPEVRPISYVDLLNIPYHQQVAPSANLGNAQLRTAVGVNASLLDTKKTLDMYRANVKKAQDPSIQYEFSVFMVNVAQDIIARGPEAEAEGVDAQELLREARQILQKLTDRGYPFAQYYLGDGYASGLFNKGKEDYERAFPLFVSGSKHGHAEAGYRAALCYEFGWGCRKDYAKAVQFYRASATKNHPGAAVRLGKACLTGDMGLTGRYREGLKWLKRAAESADAQYNSAPYELGLLHETGYGDDCFKDEVYAAQLFTQAAELGHAQASLKMGEAYEHGLLSCPRDPALSVHFYNGAAQAGLPEAMMNLCAWYIVGAEPILDKDENEAYEWSKRAAELGLPKAEYAVGYFTEMGIGCRRDPLEANVWYVRAADKGEERAKQRLAIIRAAAAGDASIPVTQVRDATVKGRKGKDDKDCIVM